DRQAIRGKQGATRKEAPQADKPEDKEQDNADDAKPEPQQQHAPGVYEFQTDRWEEIYTKRIDDTIAALKSRGVPVFWVGLPAIRGQKQTADVSYLDDLFRARADKPGIVYVHLCDRFVDDQNRFLLQGPDSEGQNRKLRANDGIHFTRPGARKLAHYLEREINRVAPLGATPVALPEPQQQLPNEKPGGPTARPIAGIAIP